MPFFQMKWHRILFLDPFSSFHQLFYITLPSTSLQIVRSFCMHTSMIIHLSLLCYVCTLFSFHHLSADLCLPHVLEVPVFIHCTEHFCWLVTHCLSFDAEAAAGGKAVVSRCCGGLGAFSSQRSGRRRQSTVVVVASVTNHFLDVIIIATANNLHDNTILLVVPVVWIIFFVVVVTFPPPAVRNVRFVLTLVLVLMVTMPNSKDSHSPLSCFGEY